ncbi:MAG: helix-turn-helix domain-containing protein [Prevotella sp.]|nr:helix-turn-helix domain-containing protein [Prevotella sp.]
MNNEQLTFNDLPQVVAQLRDEVMGMKALLTRQQDANKRHLESGTRHKPMTVEEAAAYTRLPVGTLYMKLSDGSLPATKPGKRWVLYQDELDKWLEANRRNAVPLTADEENEAILASHRRKPNKREW